MQQPETAQVGCQLTDQETSSTKLLRPKQERRPWHPLGALGISHACNMKTTAASLSPCSTALVCVLPSENLLHTTIYSSDQHLKQSCTAVDWFWGPEVNHHRGCSSYQSQDGRGQRGRGGQKALDTAKGTISTQPRRTW